ncbi:iron ABC transporter substrate-binding protein [Oscillatoria acuminata]|uniref:ABC-type Fe3+ transport system, periplasmic component n=1 Tax=Oscillatoria acuminata PCC 6304 TaxID=56110 RepID=K9TFL2_9CYAN|nr:iron ABC transporter substrate-binding protein [Oscillatoria acuminata]AFY80921.1 ABC-type Fe3+ transport system, periplasmic component [Oscillatoria acuminata PCC 6304]
MKRRKILSLLGLALASGGLAVACSNGTTPTTTTQPDGGATPAANPVTEQQLVVYSGRNENLVGSLIEQFKTETGIDIQVRYGDTAELASAILEEGPNTPADVFFAQDAGALGALQKSDRTAKLPQEILNQVEARYRSPEGEWVGITGRVRTLDYNTNLVSPEEVPQSLTELTDPQWEGRIGWAPTNGSFQAFVTALRLSIGEEQTKEWLQGIQANNPQVYPNNTSLVEAISRGEVAIGLTNHYYLERIKAENTEVPVAHAFPNDVGSLVNVAGVSILQTTDNLEGATQFVNFMLSPQAQEYFAQETHEYPLATGIVATKDLKPLSDIKYPDIDLSNLDDLEGTLQLLQESGIL